MSIVDKVYHKIEDSFERHIVFQKEFTGIKFPFIIGTIGKLVVKVYDGRTAINFKYIDEKTRELREFDDVIIHDLLYGTEARAIIYELSKIFDTKLFDQYDINTVELLTPMVSNKLYHNEPVIVGRTLKTIFDDVYHIIIEEGEYKNGNNK